MMSDRLALQPLELDVDPLSFEYFDVLREAVQPDSHIPTNDAVQQLLSIMSKADKFQSEVINFLYTCFETAEQIPYNHSSQSKLITLIYLVLNSDKIKQPFDDTAKGIEMGSRYTQLSQAFGDLWNSSKPSEKANAYVNFQSFGARIYEHGMMSGMDTATQTCDKALKDPKNVDENDREAYVMAASQWILILGSQIYRDVLDQTDAPFSPTPKQWRKWREELQQASSKESGKTYVCLRDEARLLARRAVEEMQALELKMKS